MDIKLLFETVVHLKPTQVVYQLLAKVFIPKLKAVTAPKNREIDGLIAPIVKYPCCSGNNFTFLNIKDSFHSWNQTERGMLWAYNLNYMDWLGQECMSAEECCQWIDKFIAELSDNKVGLDPYPIALRVINWVKFFCKYSECATRERLDSLYSQALLLEKKLEYRLLGNHLLEDAYALFICSCYFKDERLHTKASKLLLAQLKEQILPDGAHYEQSPMYHCIMLDRLMDCYNFSLTTDDTDFTDKLRQIAIRMLEHLESIVWNDRNIPLLNDAAYGIAPTAEQLFDYAKRLGLTWKVLPMSECGYRKMQNSHFEAIVYVGNITATYQPGHTHADSLNYELRIDGKPFVVDTGISTYDKTPRRQYERSTAAHNCVVVNNQDSSHVWGGFRVGKRCHTEITEISENIIVASHNGYDKPCKRKFAIEDNAFVVEDWYDGEAVSYIHLAEGADINRIHVDGAAKIEVEENRYSMEYNKFIPCKVLKIYFCGTVKYTIA